LVTTLADQFASRFAPRAAAYQAFAAPDAGVGLCWLFV
jgi:hypothetical protein